MAAQAQSAETGPTHPLPPKARPRAARKFPLGAANGCPTSWPALTTEQRAMGSGGPGPSRAHPVSRPFTGGTPSRGLGRETTLLRVATGLPRGEGGVRKRGKWRERGTRSRRGTGAPARRAGTRGAPGAATAPRPWTPGCWRCTSGTPWQGPGPACPWAPILRRAPRPGVARYAARVPARALAGAAELPLPVPGSSRATATVTPTVTVLCPIRAPVTGQVTGTGTVAATGAGGAPLAQVAHT